MLVERFIYFYILFFCETIGRQVISVVMVPNKIYVHKFERITYFFDEMISLW